MIIVLFVALVSSNNGSESIKEGMRIVVVDRCCGCIEGCCYAVVEATLIKIIVTD